MQRHLLRKAQLDREEHNFLRIENEIENNSQSRQRSRNINLNTESITGVDECVFSVDQESQPSAFLGLSMIEALMLLSLDSKQRGSSALLSLSDNLPSVLRCCILVELALRKRIGLTALTDSDHSPLKFPLELVNYEPTGDQFLDEAFRILKQHPSGTFSLQKWIEILTGEVWDRKLSNCQMYQLRERVCKSLLEKRIVGVDVYRTLLIVEQVAYPVKDVRLLRSLCYSLIDTATGKIPFQYYNLLLLFAVKAAGLMSACLNVADAPTSSDVRHAFKGLQERFQRPHELAKLFPALEPGQLYLISGIIEYFSKINDLF